MSRKRLLLLSGGALMGLLPRGQLTLAKVRNLRKGGRGIYIQTL